MYFKLYLKNNNLYFVVYWSLLLKNVSVRFVYQLYNPRPLYELAPDYVPVYFCIYLFICVSVFVALLFATLFSINKLMGVRRYVGVYVRVCPHCYLHNVFFP